MANGIGRRTLLGATFAAMSALAACAETQPDPGPGPMHGPGSGMMGGATGMMGNRPGTMGGAWNTTNYLDDLKTELGITTKQEPAWKVYADTISGVSEQMRAMHQTMLDTAGNGSWRERRDHMNGMFQARQQAFDTEHRAANKLMSVLSPGQKAKARATLPGLAAGRAMMGQR
jgi:Spy/CpxP family protein refolding chaperone